MDALATNLLYYPLRFARNPLQVRVAPANPTTYPIGDRNGIDYRLSLYRKPFAGASSFELLTTLAQSELPPSTDGSTTTFFDVIFEVEKYLDADLAYHLPEWQQSRITVAEGITNEFYTAASTILPSPASAVNVTNNVEVAIKAGLRREHFIEYGNTFFQQYFGSNRAFLTWQPAQKRIQRSSPEYLYFLCNFTPLPEVIHLRCKATLANGSTSTSTQLSFTKPALYQVLCVPVGPAVLTLPANTVSYEVWLSDQDNNRISEARRYVFDIAPKPFVRHILFNNSLGGFDTLTAIGQSQEVVKTSKTLSEYYLPNEMQLTFAESVVSKVTGERELTIDTGYMTKAQLRYLQELLLSEKQYLVTDRGHVPLNLLTTDQVAETDENVVPSLRMVFRYANEEKNYSNPPALGLQPARPIKWVGIEASCEINSANGLYTGRQRFQRLRKYYADTDTPVEGFVVKANTPGTEGYIEPTPSGSCTTTPFVNTAIVRQATFTKNNCGVGFTGTAPTITISAGTYGGLTQAEADSRAEAAWQALNTQAYANAAGTCEVIVYESARIERRSNFTRNNCASGFQGTAPLIVIEAGAYTSTASQAQADFLAEEAWYALNTQAYANTNGVCQLIYNSAEITGKSTFAKSGCTGGQVGSRPTITIPAGAYTSVISQADANLQAQAAWDALNTQSYADTNGVCYFAQPWEYDYSPPVNHWHYRSAFPTVTRLFYEPSTPLNPDNRTMGVWTPYAGASNAYQFATNSNDKDFPVTTSGVWRLALRVNSWQTVTARIYRNGTLAQTLTVQIFGGVSANYLAGSLNFTPANGDLLYIDCTFSQTPQ